MRDTECYLIPLLPEQCCFAEFRAVRVLPEASELRSPACRMQLAASEREKAQLALRLFVWPPACAAFTGILNLGFRRVAFLPLQANPQGVGTTAAYMVGNHVFRLLVQGIYGYGKHCRGLILHIFSASQNSFSCWARTPSKRAFMSPILRLAPGKSNPSPR